MATVRPAMPAPASASLIRVEKRGGLPVAANFGSGAHAIVDDQIRFRISSEDLDYYGDEVVQAGLEFPSQLPAVADHSHTLDASIGEWLHVERAGRETFATLRLLPLGKSRSADLVRALHEGGFPLASSVNFDIHTSDIEPITRSGPDGKPRRGKRYRRGKVVEVTLTQFPANPAAIAVARSLGFSDDEVGALSRIRPPSLSIARTTTAVAGAPPKPTTMTLAEMIAAAQAAHEAALAAQATAITALEADAGEANMTAVARATSEADALFTRLTTLRAAETAATRRAAAAPAPAPAPATTSSVARDRANGAADNRSAAILTERGDPEAPVGSRLARLVMAVSIARSQRRNLADVAAELFGSANERDRELVNVARADGGADTTTATWAAELVRTETRALLDATINPNSIWPKLAAAGVSMNFNGAHSVVIPQMNVGTTVGGAWVGEGGVIPLVKGSFGSKRLYAYKLAGIIPITKELQRTSDPQAVAVMSEMLRQFLSNLLDASMIDASAEVTGVRPAGLLNGVTPIAGAAGGGYEALRADLEAVTNAFTAAGIGSKPILLVPASKSFRLSTMVNALGQLVFPNGGDAVLGFQTIASQFIAPNTAIAVSAEKFASAIDPPELDSSEEATLTMADAGAAAPTQAGAAAGGGALGIAGQVVPDGGIPVAGGAGASTTGYTALSLFQSWLIGLRLVVPASYGVTRAGAVQQLTGITW